MILLLSSWRSTKCQAVHASDPLNPKAIFGGAYKSHEFPFLEGPIGLLSFFFGGPKRHRNIPTAGVNVLVPSTQVCPWVGCFESAYWPLYCLPILHQKFILLRLLKDLFVNWAPFLTWFQDSAAVWEGCLKQAGWGRKRALAILCSSIFSYASSSTLHPRQSVTLSFELA